MLRNTKIKVEKKEKVKKFANGSSKACGITEKIMEFIALDDEPFPVVDDTGFHRLKEHIEARYTLPSRRYFAETCLPKMFYHIAQHANDHRHPSFKFYHSHFELRRKSNLHA